VISPSLVRRGIPKLGDTVAVVATVEDSRLVAYTLMQSVFRLRPVF